MKKLLLFIINFCFVAAMGQNLIAPITISLPANPPANTADWATAMPPVMITAQTRMQNGQISGIVIESKILVTIKSGGSIICGSYNPQSAPQSNFNSVTKTWSGAAVLSLLGKDCILKPGTYELCVQFYGRRATPAMELIGEACKSFTIADTKQQTYSPPQNIVPVNGKVFTEQEANMPIMLRWTPVLPKPKADVNYKVRLIEILPGQNRTEALRNNAPIDIQEVKNQTQTNTKLSKRCNNCEYVWNVEASKKSQLGDIEMLGTSEATSFSVKTGNPNPEKFNPPVNQLPVDGKVFTKEEIDQPIRFTWSPVTPTPKEGLLYKVRVVEIKKGQPRAEALRTNTPIEILEVKNLTQVSSKLSKRCNNCEYIWDVEAVGTQRVQGEAPKSYGTSEATAFRIIITDPGGCMAIDTTKYTVTCKGIDAQGRYIYQINDLILKNISTNPGRTGLFANPATNYIIPNPMGSFTIQNLIPASANPINSGNQISISFEAHSSSTTSLSFFVDGTIPLGATFCDKHIQVDIDQLPSCICDPCKGKTTTFGNIAATPLVTYQNNGAVSVSSTVTHTPEKVLRVSAQIVDVQRLGESGCLRCTKDSREFGNFTGGSLNNNGGRIVNGSNGYGKQIQWDMSPATHVNNFNYDLQMMFPPLTEVSCCKDSLKICIRWSFVDDKCVTCDTLICSVIKREYKTPSGPIWTPNVYATQMSKMGEPFNNWYKQESKELPKNFNEQVDALYRTSEAVKESEIKKDVFTENMKSIFYQIQSLRSTASADAVWNAIAGNPLNTHCGGGDFASATLNTGEWSGAWRDNPPSISANNPSLFSPFSPGFSPVSVGLNSPMTTVNHHSIVTHGNDPIVGALLKTTSSVSNLHSFRLGNSSVYYGAEILSKKFVVGGNGIIKFMYASVFNDGGHGLGGNPSFWVKVYDNAGTPITNVVYLEPSSLSPLDYIVGVSNPTFFQNALGGAVKYRNWTCAKIDLSNYQGQTVSVAFVTTDCNGSAHYGYTYIDDWCGSCQGATSGSVTLKPIQDPCIKPGAQVCVDYTLPTGTTTGSGSITLNFYQNGNPIAYSLTSPTLTVNGTYCFNIDPTRLPCNNGQQGYDVVATGNFTIGSSSVIVTSPDPVGAAGNVQGIIPGKNNDLLCCIPPADNCCTNFVKRVTAQVTMVGNTTTGYNTIKFVPTFTAGPRLIKQVRISIVNMESSSTNKECLTCETNTASYGTMTVPQSWNGGGKDAIEGMSYPTNPLISTCLGCPPIWKTGRLTHEVIWGSNAGPGYNLMDGAGDQSTSFTVHLPRRSTLSCCDDTIKVCIKYSFTDVDCKTCDTIICYNVVNRNTISLLSTLSPIFKLGNSKDKGYADPYKGQLIDNGLVAAMSRINNDKN